MKNITLLYFTCFVALHCLSQTQTISAQKTFGTAFDEVRYAAKEYDGFLYLFITPENSGISQDKTIPGFGVFDAWFVKMDLNYNIISQYVYGGSYNDYGVDFVKCGNGDFILLMLSDSDISGNKTSDSFGFSDYWVVRINPNGGIVWQKTYGGSDEEQPEEIVKINENKFLLFGTSRSPISGNKTSNSFGLSDVWTVFIDGQGNILDQHVYGGSGPEFFGEVSLNLSANKIVYAVQSGSDISGNKTSPRYGFFDGWVFTTDTNGVLMNQINLGGAANSLSDVNDIIFKGNNTIFALLTSEYGIGGTKTLSGNGETDAWLVELDSNLSITNQKVYGGTQNDGCRNMFLSGDNIVLSLVSYSGIDGNKTEPNYGAFDLWFVCIDPSGTILWQKSAGGSQGENAIIVGEPSPNNYIVVGNSASGISGNKTVPLYVAGSSDLWLFKLNTTLSVENFESSIELSVSPNPFEEEINFVWEGMQEKVVLEIINLQGKIIYSKEVLNAASYKWSPENLSSGAYLYLVKTNEGVGSGRIVKQ